MSKQKGSPRFAPASTSRRLGEGEAGLSPILIVLLVALGLLIAKFLYIKVAPVGVVGVSTYRNLYGQEFSCTITPPSIASNSCFNYSCGFGVCFVIKPPIKEISQSVPTPEPTNSTETADWKTYLLNNGSFKYSPEVYLDKLVSNKNTVTIYNKDPRKYKQDVYYLGISGYKGKWESLIESKSISSNQAKPTKLGSLQVYQLAGLPTPGGVSEETYVVDGKLGYIQIRIGNIPTDSQTNKAFILFRNTVDQILSTFKFTQ